MVKVSDIVTLVRQGIRDPGKTIVTNDAALYPLILAAVREVAAMVPEVMLAATGAYWTIPPQITGNDGFDLPDSYLTPVADYAVHRYYLGDIGSVRDERRANDFMAAFERALKPQES